jgi:hypothetical protein
MPLPSPSGAPTPDPAPEGGEVLAAGRARELAAKNRNQPQALELTSVSGAVKGPLRRASPALDSAFNARNATGRGGHACAAPQVGRRPFHTKRHRPFFLYAVGPHLFTAHVYRDKSIFDLLGLTPLVWGWMFGFGMLAAKHFDRILPCLRYAPLLIVPLAVMIPFGEGVAFGSRGNSVGIVYFACYAGLILWLAFCTPYVRLPFDISYGTYIWHMPIVNLLLLLSVPSLPVALALTASLALASWFLVERPALRLKKKSIHENP